MTPADVVTGNVYDKYGTRNPVARRLMAGFEAALDDLFGLAAPESLLDVGCGEGVLTERWAQRLGPERQVIGVDLDDPGLQAQWQRRLRPGLTFKTASATALEFEDGAFDTVTAIEVLEHVEDPAAALAELARVAQRHLLLSVPREPVWRLTNLARGAYLRDLGNTPGHVNHWSREAFVRFAGRFGTVIESRSPFPWTMILVSAENAGVRPR